MVFYTQDSNFNTMISNYPLMHAISFVCHRSEHTVIDHLSQDAVHKTFHYLRSFLKTMDLAISINYVHFETPIDWFYMWMWGKMITIRASLGF